MQGLTPKQVTIVENTKLLQNGEMSYLIFTCYKKIWHKFSLWRKDVINNFIRRILLRHLTQIFSSQTYLSEDSISHFFIAIFFGTFFNKIFFMAFGFTLGINFEQRFPGKR